MLGLITLVLYGYTIKGDMAKEIGFGVTIAVIIVLFTYIEVSRRKND